jgi:putative flippase GtrA
MSSFRFFSKHRARFFFLVRYGVSGVIGGLIQTAFLYVWVSVLGLEKTYLVGLVLGFIVALVVNFLLQKYWTFQDSASHKIPRQLVLYSAVALSGLALNALLLAGSKALFAHLGINFFHGWYVLVQLLIFCIVSVFNLTMNFLFTFRKR